MGKILSPEKKRKNGGDNNTKNIRVSDAVLLYVRILFLYLYVTVNIYTHTRCVRDPHYYDDD
jgi:hypothetical protein